MSGPLSGYRVLDLSAVVSGPLTAALLADQGADVIKVERTGAGDIQRHVGSNRNGFSGFFHVLNRGKRSLALNLASPEGVAIVHRLAEQADVVIQNFRPGVADRLGIGYSRLSAINNGIVYLSISGFGQTGPRARDRAYDPIIQMYSGIAHVQGRIHLDHAEVPEQVNMLLLDKLTAWTGCQAITAGLLARAKGQPGGPPAGTGQHIELSMLDTAITFAWSDTAADLILQDTNHRDERPPIGASGTVQRYADGWGATMTLTQAEFAGMCRAYDLEHIATDARFSSLEARIQNRDALRELLTGEIAAKAATMTVESAAARMQAEQVPFARSRRLDELESDSQVQHNHTLRHHQHPVAGLLLEARPAPIFYGTPLEPAASAPTVGQHTRAVLAELGMEGDVERLIEDGVVSA